MNVYYTVSSGLQLMMAYFVRKIYHKYDFFNLIFIEPDILKEHLDDNYLLSVFDNVIREATLTTEEKLKFHKKFSKDDIFYLSSFSQRFGCKLFNKFPNVGKRILAYEGIPYYWISKFAFSFKNQNAVNILQETDKILVLDKEMFTDDKYFYKVEEVPLKNLLRYNNNFEKCCFELNNIFKYKYQNDQIVKDLPKIIYFDSNLNTMGGNIIGTEQELKLLENIINCLHGLDFIVKLHPKRKKNSLPNLNFKTLPNNLIPWELIQLNRILDKSAPFNNVYITFISSAVYHSASIFGKKGSTIILLEEIAKQYVGKIRNDVESELMKDVFTRFAKKYKDVNVVSVNSFKELRKAVMLAITAEKEEEY